MREAMRVAELVLPLLTEIPEELVRNRLITEWVKREACWTRVEASDIRLTADFLATTVPLPPGGRAQLPWKENAKLLWRDGAWKRLRDWNKVEDKLTDTELTGLKEERVVGRDVSDVLGLKFANGDDHIATVLEWGVRQLGKEVEVNAEGDLPARATADLFPAYDDDGGLLLVLTPSK